MMVKCSLLLHFVSFSTLVNVVLPCVATSGGGSTTVTTTTVATTTTASGCTSCTASQVTFAQAAGTIQIDTSGILGTDAASGCLTLTATCTADVMMTAFMQFNFNQGGPAENQNAGRTINALLNCVDGNWVYTSGGVSRIVTQVSCNQAPEVVG
uniref:C6 domain-containing protein n=1 Tax=Caenorhabditis tropicalis TaxID=1561998 RepID=A0A1I7T747_9PELO